MFRFGNPEAFLWFYLVLAMALLAVYSFHSQKKKIKSSLGEKPYKHLMSSYSFGTKKLRLFLQFLALCFFVLALARPQWGQEKKMAQSEGVEVTVLFDVSNSMLAEDLFPSRLEAAQTALKKWAKKAQGDRMALVAFAGTAVLLSPLTQDKEAFQLYVNSLSPALVDVQGTRFRAAFQEALGAFQRGGLINSENRISGSQAVLVVSDGEDHGENLKPLLKEFQKKGIRIFTLGVGTKEGGFIPLTDRQGQLVDYRKDKKGRRIRTVFKDGDLRKLAQEGKGRFYKLQSGGSWADVFWQDLKKLQNFVFEEERFLTYQERYMWFLILALIFLLGDILLRERKNIL